MLAVPAAVILLGLVVYPVALVLGMAGLDAGARLVEAFLRCSAAAFSPAALPTWVPRLSRADRRRCGADLLGVGAWLAWWRAPLYRRSAGGRRGRCSVRRSMPSAAIQHATETVWRLLKGGAAIKTPEADDLSRRYAELLAENLGQPGFRELLLVVHDLDAHRDLVFGLCAIRFARRCFRRRAAVVVAARRSARPVERHAGVHSPTCWRRR